MVCAFGRQHNDVKNNPSLSLKRKIYNQCSVPVLTYRFEARSLTKALEDVQSRRRGQVCHQIRRISCLEDFVRWIDEKIEFLWH